MRLCVECKYHRGNPHMGHRCTNPDYAHESPVDGTAKDADCAIQRAAFSHPSCGPEGRGFEADGMEKQKGAA